MNITASQLPRFACLSGVLAIALSTLSSAAPVQVTDSVIATHDTTGVRILRGTVALPARQAWYIANMFVEQDGLVEIYLREESDDAVDDFGIEGEWSARLSDHRATQERRQTLQETFQLCQGYASEFDGRGPAKLSDLRERHAYGRFGIRGAVPTPPPPTVAPGENPPSAPERETPAQVASGVHLIPNVQFFTAGERAPVPSAPQPILVDTAPAIADGKHWILSTDGTAKRVVIDPEFIKTLGVTIAPGAPPRSEQPKNAAETVSMTIFARLAGDPATCRLEARGVYSDKKQAIEWDTTSAKRGESAICDEWAEMRLWNLDSSVHAGAPIGPVWAERIARQYSLQDSEYVEHRRHVLEGPQGPAPMRGRTSNIVSVFGGRAAVQETLQLRNLLADAEKEEDWKPSLPIDDIAGVRVQAHPFERMLDGKPGGSLPLADWVPADRLMAYLPRPEEVSHLFEVGMNYLSQAGADVTGRSADYALKDRYRDAFGLSEELLKRFLRTGAIEEMAIIVPDLFLIDGTEMSVVMRTGKPVLTTAALALVGVPPGDGQTMKKNRHGEPVYWVRRGPIVIVSTSEREVQAILDAKKNGTGLGKSAELRYMLTQIPVTAETVFFTYFSDPFIRNLVSPRTKIGQLRRVFARAELEEASAASLLARFDGHGKRAFDLSFLREKNYLTPPAYAADLVLDDRSVSSSGFYGSAARMTSLTDQPLDLVSPIENEAYGDYLEDYNRYWRRYFDPIAIRYEQKEDGEHVVETFILPLIENSLYGGLRGVLPGSDEQIPLVVPVMEPAPLAMISCRFNDTTWLDALEGMSEGLEELQLDPAILPHLSPDVHFALHDADPIITIGNGELQGMLGRFGAGGIGNEMGWIGAFISILTRPCTVHIGLEDPAAVRALLHRMTWPPEQLEGQLGGFGNGSLYKITGKDKWIYRFSIEDIITLRFGLEVQDRYLVINNFPFSNKVAVTSTKQAPYGAAWLELNPSACEKQLPALFHSAVERSRLNAMSGAACLFPLFAGGEHDVDAARQRHRELFGFDPQHPQGGSWKWDSPLGEVISSLYGSPWRNEQPGFDPEAASTSILREVSQIGIGMQFEQDGLRSQARWRLDKKE